MTTDTSDVTFNLGVPPSAAVVLGLTVHQICALATAAAGVLVVLLTHGSLTAVAAVIVIAGGYCWVPVRGMPVFRWVAPIVRVAAQRFTTRLWTAPIPEVAADA